MDTLEFESTTPMFMNTATLWSNRLADLFTDWSMFIIVTKIKLTTGLKILNFEIKESMIGLEQFDAGKIIQVPLDLTNPNALNQGMRDGQEGNLVKDMLPALIILINWTMIFVGTNFAITLDNISHVFLGIS